MCTVYVVHTSHTKLTKLRKTPRCESGALQSFTWKEHDAPLHPKQPTELLNRFLFKSVSYLKTARESVGMFSSSLLPCPCQWWSGYHAFLVFEDGRNYGFQSIEDQKLGHQLLTTFVKETICWLIVHDCLVTMWRAYRRISETVSESGVRCGRATSTVCQDRIALITIHYIWWMNILAY